MLYHYIIEMNDVLMQQMEIQTIIKNEDLLQYSKELKEFYFLHKKDLYEAKKELYDLKSYNKKACSNYQKKNRPKFNEYHRKLREKNRDKFFCHFCNHGYCDAPHYKIHCQSLKHISNMEKIKL